MLLALIYFALRRLVGLAGSSSSSDLSKDAEILVLPDPPRRPRRVWQSRQAQLLFSRRPGSAGGMPRARRAERRPPVRPGVGLPYDVLIQRGVRSVRVTDCHTNRPL